MENFKDYRKYKWFFALSGNLVLGGKNAAQNDELINRVKESGKEYLIMHTSEPGSPFSVILSDVKKLSKKDIAEASIFTGCFSRAWRQGKEKTRVEIFKSSQLYKSKNMKTGTWGVAGETDEVEIKLELVLTRQDGILRAIPEKSVKDKKQILLKISPGNIEKKDMPAKLDLELSNSFSQEEILSALPTGGFRIIRK